MGLMNALTRLDAKVVPRLARGAVRVGEAVRGWRIRPLTVLATILVLAVGATAAWRLSRPDPGGSDGASPLWVGVREGDSIPGYVESTKAELAVLTAEAPDNTVFALVSFAKYLTPAELASVINQATGVGSVLAYGRVPLPDRQTERVAMPAQRLPDDIVASMASIAARKEVEAGTYDRLASEQTDQALRLIYTTNAEVARAEAVAYQGPCGCVFALLVRAAPQVLLTLALRTEVRAVDPVPEIRQPSDAVISPPYPEQQDRVQPPPDESFSTP